MDKLFKIYSKHLKTAKAREELDELTALARSGKRLCLLCFERDAGSNAIGNGSRKSFDARTGAKVHASRGGIAVMRADYSAGSAAARARRPSTPPTSSVISSEFAA